MKTRSEQYASRVHQDRKWKGYGKVKRLDQTYFQFVWNIHLTATTIINEQKKKAFVWVESDKSLFVLSELALNDFL